MLAASFFRRLVRLLPAVAAALGGLSTEARGGDTTGSPANVVLVHGIFNTGRIFNPLAAVLEREGCRCFAPSLRPNSGANGVHDLARKLAAQIDQHFGPAAPIFVVGFSLGGLVTRDYVQTLAPRGRIRGVFSSRRPTTARSGRA